MGQCHTPFHDEHCNGLDFTRFPSRSPPKPSFGRVSGSIKFPLTRALHQSWSRSLAVSSHYVGKFCSRLPRDVGAAVLQCCFVAVHAAFSYQQNYDCPTKCHPDVAFRLPTALWSCCSGFRAKICNVSPGIPASVCVFAQASRHRAALCVFPSPAMHQGGVFGDCRGCTGTIAV